MDHGVICLWEYDPQDKHKWKLVESYQVDLDGCAIYRGATDRYDWMYDDEKDEEVMGRAVTLWTFLSGVRLLAFNPPEWIPWLSLDYWEKFRKNEKWAELLADGYYMELKTAEAAQSLLTVPSDSC